MTLSLSECLRRCQALAETCPEPVAELTQDTNININKFKNNKYYNININSSEIEARTLSRILQRDPVFREAQDVWGMYGGSLMRHLKEKGSERVRAVLKQVQSYGDTYFKPGRPVSQQRGALAQHILQAQ